MKNMKRIREARGLTLVELEQQTGVNRELLGRYEKGYQHPSVQRAALIARTLNVPLDDLVGSDEPASPVLG